MKIIRVMFLMVVLAGAGGGQTVVGMWDSRDFAKYNANYILGDRYEWQERICDICGESVYEPVKVTPTGSWNYGDDGMGFMGGYYEPLGEGKEQMKGWIYSKTLNLCTTCYREYGEKTIGDSLDFAYSVALSNAQEKHKHNRKIHGKERKDRELAEKKKQIDDIEEQIRVLKGEKPKGGPQTIFINGKEYDPSEILTIRSSSAAIMNITTSTVIDGQ